MNCPFHLLIVCSALAFVSGAGFGGAYSEVFFGGLPYIAAAKVRALDGDTLEATFVLHVDGYDAPELDSQRCSEEQVKAALSRDRANELLSHPPVRIKILGEDKNGKLAARVVAGDRPLGLMMEFEGHLKKANGGPLNWCPGAANTEPNALQRMMAGP